MSENEIIKDLQAAFQDIDQRVQSDPAENFDASVCQQLLEDFYLFNSLDKAYYLPKILIGWINNHSKVGATGLMSLIELLDVDFYDPDNLDNLLKTSRLEMIEEFNHQKFSAICNWLEFVGQYIADTYDLQIYQSALKFWKYHRDRAAFR